MDFKDVKILEAELEDAKRVARREFRERFHEKFRFMDLLVVIVVLFNFGAVTMTNYVVDTINSPGGFREVNPTSATIYGVAEHPKAMVLFGAFKIWTAMWSVLIILYVYFRFNVMREETFYTTMSFISAYFIVLGLDFFNDFGHLIYHQLFMV